MTARGDEIPIQLTAATTRRVAELPEKKEGEWSIHLVHILSSSFSSSMSTEKNYYIGVDIGTGSARACLVDASGHIAASDTQDTKTWRDENDHRIFEQSTTDIWSKICIAVKNILQKSGIDKSAVKGIGFDATCSLAVTDFKGNPVSVTKGKDIGSVGERNIILWADHRAEKEAELINSTDSIVLNYVGGTMSVCLHSCLPLIRSC